MSRDEDANTIQTQLQILTAVVKLFLKKPDQAQGLVTKVLQAATADNDNPDIRDRAYVYWRLLSSDPQITKVCGVYDKRIVTIINVTQEIVLSDKPPITSTIRSLPPQLLENLLTELSTLASVYHKPPEAFLGQGRFGAEAMQRAAIEEQQEEARENPIAAAAAAVAAGGQAPANVENLLDIDFDGSAPASMQKQPTPGTSGLEGLAGTPQRVASPVGNAAQPQSNMDDLLGLFGDGGGAGAGAAAPGGQMSNDDIMNGFASMSMETSQPPPASQQLGSGQQGKKSNQDLLDLF